MNGADGSSTVKSDETLLAIIEQLKALDGAGVTKLARDLDLAKSAVHKHLQTMVEHGYVVNENGTYRIGLQFLNDGEYVRNSYDVYHAAKSQVDALAAETEEMVWLIVEENGRGMYLYGARGETEIAIESILGSWTTLHNNSGGKAILAHLPEEHVNRILDRQGLPKETQNTITDREELFADLERVRERGYATNHGEDLEGIYAIGVPLFFEGELRGALSVAGAARRFRREGREADLVDRLLTAADDIEVNLAYQ